MARVTVEDCIDKVENRFDLVLLAAHRARMISSGAPITVDRDNDKNPVVALREISDTTVSPEDLREELGHSLQKYVEGDHPEPEAGPLSGGRGGRHRSHCRSHDRGGAASWPRRVDPTRAAAGADGTRGRRVSRQTTTTADMPARTFGPGRFFPVRLCRIWRWRIRPCRKRN